MTYVLFLRNKNTLIFHTVSTIFREIIFTKFFSWNWFHGKKNLIAHITQYNNTDWVLFSFKSYFKQGFWIIFLLLLFFFTSILSEKTRPFQNICQFYKVRYTKQFQDLCWTKSSTEMLQKFSCENTFLYDFNFELLQN